MPHFPVILLAPSPPMDGRNTGVRTLTRAESDIEAISAWLAKYTDNKNTFDAYRRDVRTLFRVGLGSGKGARQPDGR